MDLEFEPPGFADLLTDPSLAAPSAAVGPPALETATAPEPAMLPAGGPADIGLPAQAIGPRETAAAPVDAVSDAGTASPNDPLDDLPAVPAGVKAGAQEALDSTWLDRWPAPLAAEQPPAQAAKEPAVLRPTPPEPIAAMAPQSGMPAGLVASPNGPPGWPDGDRYPAPPDFLPPIAVAAGANVPPPEPRTAGRTAGIAMARSAPASLAATIALAPAGPPHPAEAVALFVQIVAGLQPPGIAGARQLRPQNGVGGRQFARLRLVLLLLLLVGLAAVLAFVSGHLPSDVSLARIRLR